MSPNKFLLQCSITTLLLFFTVVTISQPYYDALLFKGTLSPDAGLWRRNNIPVDYNHYIGGIALPIQIGKDSTKLILSSFTEHWNIQSPNKTYEAGAEQALYFPVTLLKPISKKWNVALTAIPRWNGPSSDLFNNSFQMGVSVIAAYKRTPALTWRVGAYYNSEFFGPFFIPLFGLDWKISSKDNLFGVLPQILTYEHRVSQKFSWGAVYRMFNNSYRTALSPAGDPAYMRINEMQLLLSSDIYLAKRIVLNIEAGHSIFRRIRFGTDKNGKDYSADDPVNDGFLIKAGLLYRIRLR